MKAQKKSPEATSSMQEALRALGPYMGLGLQLALGMAFFAVGGYLLDRWLGTLPWLTLVGVVLGLVAIVAKLWQVNALLQRRSRRSGHDAAHEK
ncbi:AtpZ/AtpI family protein [Rhodothermus marinus]|jgi:ATP synthase protein I|uniref:AtpZ/AtpI family protein n=2 Tax=Rhodothermus marinus TaxID=29549 RepID=UPI000223D69D|nr:AtpZ/AtpI family protein [Rhodothermus marinus]AEN72238.1 ATP synthase protein I [Rhodothermus marinus SG0.5JP17-172]